jgi:carbonic anhydrase/acetyltransferase-like protein (isoleucine patch superfamily)
MTIFVVQPSLRRVALKSDKPELNCAFIAPSASVIGKVKIGEHSSVWYNAVIRGDVVKYRHLTFNFK